MSGWEGRQPNLPYGSKAMAQGRRGKSALRAGLRALCNARRGASLGRRNDGHGINHIIRSEAHLKHRATTSMKMPELMSTMSSLAVSLSDYSSLCSRREILCPKSPTLSVLGQDFPHAFLAETHFGLYEVV